MIVHLRSVGENSNGHHPTAETTTKSFCASPAHKVPPIDEMFQLARIVLRVLIVTEYFPMIMKIRYQHPTSRLLCLLLLQRTQRLPTQTGENIDFEISDPYLLKPGSESELLFCSRLGLKYREENTTFAKNLPLATQGASEEFCETIPPMVCVL